MFRLTRLLTCLTAVLGLIVLAGCPGKGPSDPPLNIGGPGSYLLCFWNVENLFDDKDDGRTTKGDKDYDNWFATDKAALAQKLKNIGDVLLPLNGGKGPDIVCLAELESARSAELVKETLNARLTDPALHYSHVLFENPSGGRSIATAIVTRLPVKANRTQLLGKRLRILEGHIEVLGKPLVVIASHWSSRVSDHTGDRRSKYADQIYGRFKGMYIANPKVDFLVCGDFNDNPDDRSVTDHLRATGDREVVLASAGKDPKLFNLMAGPWKKGEASHYYGKHGYLFDQICVSPGLLDDEGWSVDPGSAAIIKEMATKQGHPNRFGNARDRRPLSARGASDHFPVMVRLTVR